MPRMVAFSGYSASICSAIPWSCLGRAVSPPSSRPDNLQPASIPAAAAVPINSRLPNSPAISLLPLVRYNRRCEREQPLIGELTLVVGGDEFLENGRDLLAPLAAIEDAVVADVGSEEILLFRARQVGRDVERGLGLANAGNIIPLALDRQQSGVPDRGRVDQAAVVLKLAFGKT